MDRDPVVRSGPVFRDFTKTKDQTSRSGPVLRYCGDRTAQRPRPRSGPGLGAVLVRPDQYMGRSESGSVCERVKQVEILGRTKDWARDDLDVDGGC
jgi:hypothetical protein